MTALTIRTITESTKRKLKISAAKNGRSMDAEATAILDRHLGTSTSPQDLGSYIGELMKKHGVTGVDLQIDPREPMPDPVTFE